MDGLGSTCRRRACTRCSRLLRFSYERGAYVLRFVGETRGPVLRKDRRRNQQDYAGPDRREGGVDLTASRPRGNVRRIEVGEQGRREHRQHRSRHASDRFHAPVARSAPTLAVAVVNTADSDRRARIADPAARLTGA